jgi:hypothetical protein
LAQSLTAGICWDKRAVEMVFSDAAARRFGRGVPSFRVKLNNEDAVHAITCLDQVEFR